MEIILEPKPNVDEPVDGKPKRKKKPKPPVPKRVLRDRRATKMSKFTFDAILRKMRKWAKQFKIKIKTGDEPAIICRNKTITYDRAQEYHKSLYEICHEFGHFFIGLQEDYDEIYPFISRCKKDKRTKRTIKYRMDILREESAAWEKGFNISKEMGMEFDLVDYFQHASKCLFGYCEWAAKRDWNDEIWED